MKSVAYLVQVALPHQLVLVLQRVLEQGPDDGFQLRVGGQQVGAQHLQSGVGQAVHCRGDTEFLKAVLKRHNSF